VRREVELVRSALLYADHVQLISTTTAMFDTLRPLQSIDLDNPWDDIRRLPKETLERVYGRGNVKSAKKALARLTQLPMHDPGRTALEAWHRPRIREAVTDAMKLYEQAMTPELDVARERGLLSIDVSAFELDDPGQAHVEWFRERLVRSWDDPTGTVLLDTRSRRLLGRTSDGVSPRAAFDRSKRAAVGAGLVQHLPTFPSAPMSHVLEARDELADSRKRYRAGVRELSAKMASSALDDSLSSDITEYGVDVIEPTLNDMRASLPMSRLVHGTARRLFGDGAAALKSGGLTVAVATAQQLAGVPTLAGVGGGAMYVLGTAWDEARAARENPAAPELLYLSGLERNLEQLAHRR